MGELASGASFHVGDSGEVSLGAVRQQWRSKTKGSRTELLQLLRDGLAAYVVYVVHVATVRASKSTLPSLGAAPPKLANHEDEGAMMRDGFEFMVEMCNTDSVPEAPQYLASAGAVAAVLEASLLHSVTFPEDDATVEFALGAVVALLQEEGQDVIALEKGALRLAARVRAGAPAKAKEHARRILLTLAVRKGASAVEGAEVVVARLLEIVSGLCQDRAEISVLEKTLRAVANLCGGNPSVSRAALSKSCFTILGKCGDVSAKLTPSSAEALACAIGTVSQTLCSASAAAADGSRDAGASASTSAAAETDLPGQRLSRAALLHLLDMFAQEAPTVETCARALGDLYQYSDGLAADFDSTGVAPLVSALSGPNSNDAGVALEVCRALRLMLCRKPALSYADLVDTPPSPWPSGSGRVMEVVRSRKSRPQRAGALVKVAVAAGAFDAVFSRVASHAQNGSFQEEAMMTLAVLCHSGEPVPQDEAVWVRVQEAMKLHSGRGEVITEACILMAVLAAQEEPSAADIAGLFTGELIAILTRHHAHAPTAVSAACYALMCIIRSTAESASKYLDYIVEASFVDTVNKLLTTNAKAQRELQISALLLFKDIVSQSSTAGDQAQIFGMQKIVQDLRDDVDAVQARRKRPGQAQFRLDDEPGCLLQGGGGAAAVAREDKLRETCDAVLNELHHLRRMNRLQSDDTGVEMLSPRASGSRRPSLGGGGSEIGGSAWAAGERGGVKKFINVRLLGQKPQNFDNVVAAVLAMRAPGPPGSRGSVSWGRRDSSQRDSSDDEIIGATAAGAPSGPRPPMRRKSLAGYNSSGTEEDWGILAAGGVAANGAQPPPPLGAPSRVRRTSLVDILGGGGPSSSNPWGRRMSAAAVEQLASQVSQGSGQQPFRRTSAAAAEQSSTPQAAAAAAAPAPQVKAGARQTLPTALSQSMHRAQARISTGPQPPMPRPSVGFQSMHNMGSSNNEGPWSRWGDAQPQPQPQPPQDPPTPGRGFLRRMSAPSAPNPSPSLLGAGPRSSLGAFHGSLHHPAPRDSDLGVPSGFVGRGRTLEPLNVSSPNGSAGAGPNSLSPSSLSAGSPSASEGGGPRPAHLPPLSPTASGAHRIDQADRSPNGQARPSTQAGLPRRDGTRSRSMDMPRMMPSPANGSGSGGADDANTPPEAGGYDPSRSAVVPTMMNRLMSGGNGKTQPAKVGLVSKFRSVFGMAKDGNKK